MSEPESRPIGAEPSERVAALKERVYVTFSTLGVVLALQADAAHETAGHAAFVVVISAVATILAVTIADAVASTVVHHALPDRREVAHLGLVAAGALLVVVVPLLLIAAAAVGLLPLALALGLAAGALALTLVAVGALAVRRLGLTGPQQLVAIAVEALLAAAVIALELLVH